MTEISNRGFWRRLVDYAPLLGLGCVILLIALAILWHYFLVIGLPAQATTQAYGTLGDFIGGVLNPLLAFGGFVALLWTLHVQRVELRLTREELKSARDVAIRQARHLEDKAHRADLAEAINSQMSDVNWLIIQEVQISLQHAKLSLGQYLEPSSDPQQLTEFSNRTDMRKIALGEHHLRALVVHIEDIHSLIVEYEKDFSESKFTNRHRTYLQKVADRLVIIGYLDENRFALGSVHT